MRRGGRRAQAAATRRNLAGLLEDIGTKGAELPVVGELMGAFFQCLTAFLHDAAPAVAKRSLTAGAVLFKRTLLAAQQQGRGPAVPKPLREAWAAAEAFKREAALLARKAPNDGVHLHAVKFMEVSGPLDGATGRGAGTGWAGSRRSVCGLNVRLPAPWAPHGSARSKPSCGGCKQARSAARRRHRRVEIESNSMPGYIPHAQPGACAVCTQCVRPPVGGF